ncbi:hypothetical protein PAMC26577_14315 [Caballeronia sordidicola]|uniref:Uncharacterized protein n=1 Tax=Caballeronia sordidicola TaxID=196367 RepID=A0A242MTX3_CABSO|nr:hypothetical protein PAMC26577_14315 [Caballeronia sordidicola]
MGHVDRSYDLDVLGELSALKEAARAMNANFACTSKVVNTVVRHDIWLTGPPLQRNSYFSI